MMLPTIKDATDCLRIPNPRCRSDESSLRIIRCGKLFKLGYCYDGVSESA